jgi:hypothetical protein
MKDPAAPRHSHARGGSLQRGRQATRRLAAGPRNGAVLLSLVLLALSTACASADPGTDAGGTAGAGDAAGGISRPENDLVIDLDPGDGSGPYSWTLVCAGVAEGTHPDAEAACTHLQGLDEPFAPIPPDAACTEQYGGPETAHVTGVWGGRTVDLQLARNNGCTISQWESLGPLLAVPGTR